MHYYKFNIKDYSYATIRMSLMEDLAFRRMLDLFYETEKPLPFEIANIARLIGMRDHQEEIRNILNDFWTETESGWINQRAFEEVAEYQARAETARANGKKGGRPKNPEETQSVPDRNPEKSESKANHKPLTINHNKESDRSIDQSRDELLDKSFNWFWGVWKDCKKQIGKIDTSPKKKTFDKKWRVMFNSAYFKKHSVDDFKSEVNLIAKFCKEAHSIQGFNRFENMQLPKFLEEKQWRDKNE